MITTENQSKLLQDCLMYFLKSDDTFMSKQNRALLFVDTWNGIESDLKEPSLAIPLEALSLQSPKLRLESIQPFFRCLVGVILRMSYSILLKTLKVPQKR